MEAVRERPSAVSPDVQRWLAMLQVDLYRILARVRPSEAQSSHHGKQYPFGRFNLLPGRWSHGEARGTGRDSWLTGPEERSSSDQHPKRDPLSDEVTHLSNKIRANNARYVKL